MVRISEDMIRRRAEHNNCELSTLEEVSLHQQDIERIEYIDKWCKELQILYLQSNLIPKIENVGRLKKLKYLNLALNNIERIENLEGCEALSKLDLTVNFVGELTSLESLKKNYNLQELFLTGNPCSQYEGYRDYVIATLTQLQRLDGQHIEKSERIQAIQNYGVLRAKIVQQEFEYRKKREKERQEAQRKAQEKEQQQQKKVKDEAEGPRPGFDKRWYTDISEEHQGNREQKEREKQEEENKQFWEEKTPYTPESRVEVHEHMKKLKEKQEKKDEEVKPARKLFAADGRPLNVNEAKVDFSLTEKQGENCLILEVACFKHMDTSLIDCDVQPGFVRVVLKGKVFQLALMEEVLPDSSSAQRSQITGHLVIKMPKAREVVKPQAMKVDITAVDNKKKRENVGPQLLEVDEHCRKTVDISSIVDQKGKSIPAPLGSCKPVHQERHNSESFVDDPDVPPLM